MDITLYSDSKRGTRGISKAITTTRGGRVVAYNQQTPAFSKALVEATDPNKQLVVCLRHGMLKEARRLIEKCDVNINHIVNPQTMDTPLHVAVRRYQHSPKSLHPTATDDGA